jgi:hypothetical protein
MAPRGSLRALGAVFALAGVAVLVCVALIASADMRRPAALAQAKASAVHAPKKVHARAAKEHAQAGRVHDMKHASDAVNDPLSILRSNMDVRQPLRRKMRMLSLSQQMGQSGDVDDLGLTGSSSSRFVRGPDGLRDDGDLADVNLLNSLSRSFKLDSDRADAIQARYEVPTNKLYEMRGAHDMASEARNIDSRGELAMGQRRAARSPFHMVKSNSKTMSDVDQLPTEFHVRADSTAGDLDAGSEQEALVDLGEESEAEAMANPNPAPPPSASKGIWVEPGSNKGFDSFALDSLQVSPLRTRSPLAWMSHVLLLCHAAANFDMRATERAPFPLPCRSRARRENFTVQARVGSRTRGPCDLGLRSMLVAGRASMRYC